jgi:hypothetical protein
MFFVWKYMEHWDGVKLHVEINPVSCYSFFFPSQAAGLFFQHFPCFIFTFSVVIYFFSSRAISTGSSSCTMRSSTHWTRLTYLMSSMFTGLAEEKLHWTAHNNYVCVFYSYILAAA